MAKGINYHKLTYEKVTSSHHRGRQDKVHQQTHWKPITDAIAKVLLEKGHIILVIGPLAEKVEGCIEETIHKDQQPWEVNRVELNHEYQ